MPTFQSIISTPYSRIADKVMQLQRKNDFFLYVLGGSSLISLYILFNESTRDVFIRYMKGIWNYNLTQDLSYIYKCITSRDFRQFMSGWLMTESELQSVIDVNIKSDDSEYIDYVIKTNNIFREIAIKNESALYYTLKKEKINIIKHGGICAEFGVFKGYSLKRCCKLMPECTWYGFDSFEGFDDEEWTIFSDNKLNLDQDTFSVKGQLPNMTNIDNVKLVKGFYNKSIPKFIENNNIDTNNKYFSCIHIDCDTYSAIMDIFNGMQKWFIKGTIIVFDDIVGISGINHATKALYEFEKNYLKKNNLKIKWLYCGKPPNTYSVLDRGCVLTHILFAYRYGYFSASLVVE